MMGSLPFTLAVDVGTSSLKAVIYGPAGEILETVTSRYSYQTPRPDWAEANPEDWWQAFSIAIEDLRGKGWALDACRVLAFTGQMHTAVLLDEENQPLAPTILWLDRRAAQERLGQECKYCERKGSYFSVILIDLDKFKEINDQNGHSAGDTVLETLSEIMLKNLRAEDMHCRWGGDEFLIMLKDTAEGGAVEVAQRITAAVKTEKIPFKGKLIDCTLSVGIATYVPTLRNLEETIIRADEALYEAKAKGGDNIVIESDLPSA